MGVDCHKTKMETRESGQAIAPETLAKSGGTAKTRFCGTHEWPSSSRGLLTCASMYIGFTHFGPRAVPEASSSQAARSSLTLKP